jgi:hypothetical protein
MLALQDFAPTPTELLAVAPYPEQVAIGYLRAWRKTNGGKRSDGRPIYDPDRYSGDVGDLFNSIFKPKEQ